jgi:hypothetical protein
MKSLWYKFGHDIFDGFEMQYFKLRGLQLHCIKQLKNDHSNFKDLLFWSQASEDIMTKFKSQALHIIRNKYWKASGSDNPPSLIPALQKIAILGLKSAKRPNIFWGSVCSKCHDHSLFLLRLLGYYSLEVDRHSLWCKFRSWSVMYQTLNKVEVLKCYALNYFVLLSATKMSVLTLD